MSKSSHLLGHMADAPWPSCTFMKSRAEGARYTGPVTSQSVSHVRPTGRTLSVVAAFKDVLDGEGDLSGAADSMDHLSGSDSE